MSLRYAIALLLATMASGCDEDLSSAVGPTPNLTPTSPAIFAATVTIQANARTLSTAAFVPNPVIVSSGGVVTWSNTDTTTHDMVEDGGAWDSGRMAPGGGFDFTFSSKGSFPYHCSIHSGMVGTVVVQ